MSTSFAPFRHRAFTLVWFGAMVSNIGTWMETTALSFYVADTAKASWSGIVAAAGFLPGAVLSPVGGAWADRFRRRNVLIGTNACAAVIGAIVALTVASGDATPPIIALLSLAAGCTNALGFPSFQATLPDLVPPEELVAAIGLSSTQWNLGRILGPTAAGVAIAIGGVPAALWCNSISFFAVVVTMLVAQIPDTPRTRRPILAAIKDSVEFGRTNPAMRSMLPLMFLVALIAAPFIGFIAQMATNVLGLDENGTSVLVTAQGIGAVVAGASMGAVTLRLGIRRVTVYGCTLIGPALVLYGLAPTLVLSAVALAVVGALYMVCISSCSTITQQSAPPELRGRALTLNNFILGFAYPVGLFIEGPIADATSLRAVTVGSGVLLVFILGALRVVRPRHTEPIALALN
jgi:MFS family permease